MDTKQWIANRDAMANQRGLPPLEPGEVRCPNCQFPYDARNRRFGGIANCTQCGRTFLLKRTGGN